MSTKSQLKAILALGALSLAASAFGNGCVSDRPSRNGVFNENQYIRKDFLVRPVQNDAQGNPIPDPGWMMQVTVTQASEPNVFGSADYFGLVPGILNNDYVHFEVTQDKLNLVSNREINTAPSAGREGSVSNAWPVTNVDLKYRVNLDGEKTNFYEENQELDWQVRQWVKVNFDKNDLSDTGPIGSFYNWNILRCTDSPDVSATLVPNSFQVDETHNYMQWSVQVTLPIGTPVEADNANCMEMMKPMIYQAGQIGRQNQTVTLTYSFKRADPNPSYQPLILGEKDPIQRKYSPFTFIGWNRDPSTGLIAANAYVQRFDPTKEIKWYFDKSFPHKWMPYFTKNTSVLPSDAPPIAGITTIEDGTNQVMMDAGAASRVSFHQFDEPLDDGTPVQRQFGDARFSMLFWMEGLDQTSSFVGVTPSVIDPRTGETIASDITFSNSDIQEYYANRIDAYLQMIGASTDSPFKPGDWPDPLDAMGNKVACTSANIGASVPLIPATIVANHNAGSTLFAKIQNYMYKPVGQFGPLGPQNFIVDHTTDNNDFFNAYFKVLPYLVYADPTTNPFVIPESGTANTGPMGAATQLWGMVDKERQLHDLEASLDSGHAPFDINGPTGTYDARTFLNTYRDLSINHRELNYYKSELPMLTGMNQSAARADKVTDFALESVMDKDARHCVNGANGPHWETKSDWVTNLISSYWSRVFWHEFGHAMGLSHNFMGSVDKPNFPTPTKNADGSLSYSMYSSSVMEYEAPADRVFWTEGWGSYDKGAIAWIYGNSAPSTAMPPSGSASYSGQFSATYPWNDPDGFAQGTEHQFLVCNERHLRYTPLCRQRDFGTTPSEIVANEIDTYEWQYKWRNFRQYFKFWDDSAYGDGPLNFVTELRRFISLWAYDMSDSELTARFTQIGVTPPMNAPSAQFYYDQLTAKFGDEMANAGALTAAFHEAIIQQSSGQRPYVTIFDNYFGDVTQQGITLDKLDALQSFVALWPVLDYDPTQSAGQYIASYSPFGVSGNINGTAIGGIYPTVAEAAVNSMIGGSYDAFAYFKPLGVAQFTVDTHSVNYINAIAGAARQDVQDWTGGWLFNRAEDFLAFFRQVAVDNNFYANIPGVITIDCTGSLETCNYDPRTPRGFQQDQFFSDVFNQFLGPDGRRYIWVYLKDVNEWFACDRDRNTATYNILHNYTSDVFQFKDDGNYGGPAYADELQIKYFLDYFQNASHYSP
jgi:hypothetical protein